MTNQAEYGIPEAATLLGQTERQVRYAIKQGKLRASKRAGRWVIPTSEIQKAPHKEQRRARQARGHQAAAEAVLGEPVPTSNSWSVTNMRSFRKALDILSGIRQNTSNEAAIAMMSKCLRNLTRGAHEFHRSDKQAHYRAAREAACDTVTELLLRDDSAAVELALQIEGELLRSIAGLLKRNAAQ